MKETNAINILRKKKIKMTDCKNINLLLSTKDIFSNYNDLSVLNGIYDENN
jgi:hypothetical protein